MTERTTHRDTSAHRDALTGILAPGLAKKGYRNARVTAIVYHSATQRQSVDPPEGAPPGTMPTYEDAIAWEHYIIHYEYADPAYLPDPVPPAAPIPLTYGTVQAEPDFLAKAIESVVADTPTVAQRRRALAREMKAALDG